MKPLPRGIWRRGGVYWIDLTLPRELAEEHGVPRRLREPAGTDLRAAQRFLAQRRREIRDRTWVPRQPDPEAPRRRPGKPTLREYAARWLERRAGSIRTVADEATRLRLYVLPTLGDRPIDEITREDVRLLVQGLVADGHLSPRSINHVYSDARGIYRRALAEGLVDRTPCTLRHERDGSELPAKVDRDPAWRRSAVYTIEEVDALCLDSRIPWDQRIVWCLLAWTGMRLGEAVGRRWRDLDTGAIPLARLVVDTQGDGQPLKVERPREVPVHPRLREELEAWRREGFALFFGRHPAPDDFIVPSRFDGVRVCRRSPVSVGIGPGAPKS